MLNAILKNFKNWLGLLQTVAASFVIASGWSWYHFAHRPHDKFLLLVAGSAAAVFIGYRVFKWLYSFLTRKFNRHIFWQNEFSKFLDNLFLLFSLFFLIFFSQYQILSVAVFLVLTYLFYRQTQKYLSRHNDAAQWKNVNSHVFALIIFLFSFFATAQYLAFKLANFDMYIKFRNIVFFRAWAMSMFFVLGFAVSTLIYWKLKSFLRYILLFAWIVLFILVSVIWVANINILYFTGIYLNPLMLAVAKGSGDLVHNWLFWVSAPIGVGVICLFVWLTFKILRTYRQNSFRQWIYYNFALIAVAVGSLVGLSSFQNTPEYMIVRNFYKYFAGKQEVATLDPAIKQKLEKFGLFYDLDRFDLAHRKTVFNASKRVLPETYVSSRPNIIIIFFESFSSRLTSVYNKRYPDLTPNLEQMASDQQTVVFKNYFNASTPTINGIIAQLCSFLPPTGYSEIEDNKGLQNLQLLCLPNILKKNGYHNTYITAVPKEFENKGEVFKSMSVENVYGQNELKKMILAEPLSWGYSDHQLFGLLTRMLKQKETAKRQVEPFLVMLSTVDTHPPFDLAKDMVKYGDGKSNILNSYHTADDAFGKFWTDFKQSSYADNTIVIAVGDHAAFPGNEIKKLIAKDGESLSFYDENLLMMYVPAMVSQSGADSGMPQSVMPKEIKTFSSSIDLAPTLLQILNLNPENNFEGHSILDDRSLYPSLLGMHEYGLYINQEQNGQRQIDYHIPGELECDAKNVIINTSTPLTLCEYLQFYKWKRQMFEQGRFWKI